MKNNVQSKLKFNRFWLFLVKSFSKKFLLALIIQSEGLRTQFSITANSNEKMVISDLFKFFRFFKFLWEEYREKIRFSVNRRDPWLCGTSCTSLSTLKKAFLKLSRVGVCVRSTQVHTAPYVSIIKKLPYFSYIEIIRI